MRQYSTLDYATLAKTGFVLGLALLVVGAGGGFIAHGYVEPVPSWGEGLFIDLGILGVLLGLLSPLIFGVILPLIE